MQFEPGGTSDVSQPTPRVGSVGAGIQMCDCDSFRDLMRSQELWDDGKVKVDHRFFHREKTLIRVWFSYAAAAAAAAASASQVCLSSTTVLMSQMFQEANNWVTQEPRITSKRQKAAHETKSKTKTSRNKMLGWKTKKWHLLCYQLGSLCPTLQVNYSALQPRLLEHILCWQRRLQCSSYVL